MQMGWLKKNNQQFLFQEKSTMAGWPLLIEQ
jgi:hypothetical protein